jgi:adenine-specific DNA glycosylase
VELALVERGGKILLTRNREGELMGGLYELPHGGLPGRTAPAQNLRDRYRGILRIELEAAATFRHTITHHRIEARVFTACLVGRKHPSGAVFHRIEEARSLPLGGLTRKALRASGLARD